MWGWLAYRAAKRTARALEQERPRSSGCPDAFDYERYERVTEKQNQPVYLNLVDMWKSALLATTLAIILHFVGWYDQNWWVITAPMWVNLVLGLTCKHYDQPGKESDDE